MKVSNHQDPIIIGEREANCVRVMSWPPRLMLVEINYTTHLIKMDRPITISYRILSKSTCLSGWLYQ
jgi:hypothetical protein